MSTYTKEMECFSLYGLHTQNVTIKQSSQNLFAICLYSVECLHDQNVWYTISNQTTMRDNSKILIFNFEVS